MRTMKDAPLAIVLWAVALVVIGAVPAVAEETFRHSGTVVAIDEAAGRLVLAEVGPWRVKDGATEVTYRTIDFTPTTHYSVVARTSETTAGFPGDYMETLVETGYLLEGDFVTVECLHQGKRMIALKVAVTELDLD